MKYFKNIHDLAGLKKEFKRLARANHPDLHPDRLNATRIMQEINAQYADRAAHLIKHGERARACAAHAEGRKVKSDSVDLDDVIQSMHKIILEILHLSKDLEIEITGLWLWVSGDTRSHKAALKKMGLRWASKKKLWYYAGVPSSGRGRSTMDDIRKSYGSARLRKEKDIPAIS